LLTRVEAEPPERGEGVVADALKGDLAQVLLRRLS
jgi:hypothetical protein